MRYWIMDRDDTPQRFPLQRLLRRVYEVAGAGISTCDVAKARGYGEAINALDERLDVQAVVTMDIADLDALSKGTEEWFYDLDAKLPGRDIRFGIHDSTALFVEAAPLIIEEIISGFQQVRPQP